MMDSFDREQLAWAAGFWDGEGCASLQSRERQDGSMWYGCYFVIAQRDDWEILEKFRRAVGMGKLRPQTRQDFQWWLSGFERCQYLACLLWPWLSDVKRTQMAAKLTTERQCDRQTSPKHRAAVINSNRKRKQYDREHLRKEPTVERQELRKMIDEGLI